MAVAFLLLVVSSALVAMTYAESRREAVASAGTQLEHLALQLASNIGQNAASLRRQAGAAASEAHFREVLTGSAPAEALRARLETSLTGTAQLFAIELWDATGRQIFSVAATNPPAVDPAWLVFPAWASPDEVTMSPPLAGTAGGTYAIAAPVRSTDRLLGYVVMRRRVVSPTNSGAVVANLIGRESRVLVGAPQSIWVNLIDLAAPLEVSTAPDAGGVYWTSDTHGEWLGAMGRVTGTPWHIRVEFPKRAVFQQSRLLLTNTIGIALAVTGLGALAGWVVSRRLIVPLRALTHAATEVAAGAPVPAVPGAGGDELGELADAFNVMAQRVNEGRRDLEARVAARTEELARALTQAEDYARQLERSNRELEAFSYTISHDLRAPLRGIDGFSEALETEYGSRLDAQALTYLARVRRAAKRMDQLINDLLELAKVSRVELVKRPVELDTLAERTVHALREREPGRHVDVHIQEGISAHGDSRLLALALQNLIENAWKFTSTRARARIEFGADPAQTPVAYFVRDTGVGFDMEHAGMLFRIFQRLHSLDQFPGTGVGLAIVHRIIERHGGRIWAEAQPDAGATFYFTLEPDHA